MFLARFAQSMNIVWRMYEPKKKVVGCKFVFPEEHSHVFVRYFFLYTTIMNNT